MKMNRRQFLAVGAAGAAVAAAAAAPASLRRVRPWNERVTDPVRKFRDDLATACSVCASRCPMTANRQNGRVAGLVAKQGGCARGLQMMEALYDGERLLSPLRRVGARGSLQWERISWEEALATLTAALAASGGRAVADLGRPDPLAGELLAKIGFGRVVTEESTRDWSGRKARESLYGRPLAAADLAGAKTVLLWGATPLDDGTDLARSAAELVASRRRGATIVAVSPRCGATGSFADRWLPIRPGFEASGALTLASRTISAGVGDIAGLSHALSLPPGTAAEGLARFAGSGAEAGLDEETLAFLAARFSAGRVAVRVDGSGLRDAYALEAAGCLLNALGGTDALRPEPAAPFPPAATDSRDRIAGELLGDASRIPLYLAYRANPVFASPQSDAVARAFLDERRVGLVVAFDTHLTETALTADLVLPATADLESWNLLAGCDGEGNSFAALQRPVQRWETQNVFLRSGKVKAETLFAGPQPGPLAEARQLGDVLAELARRRGIAPSAATAAEAVANTTCSVPSDLHSPLRADGAALFARLAAAPPAPWGETDTLSLVPVRFPELDPAFANSRLGREIRHAPPVFLNAATARRLGLSRGDRVAVEMGGAALAAEVFPVQTLHPEAIAVAHDFGHWGGGSAAAAVTAEKAAARLVMDRKNFLRPPGPPTGPARAEETPPWNVLGAGFSLTKIAPLQLDTQGGQLWRELRVTVRPAGRGA